MLLSDFDFELPQELIAQKPLLKRSDSRLLHLNKNTGKITHHYFRDLPSLLEPKDLIILNDTKVIPARLYAHKPTGGKAEILIERVLEKNKFIAQTKTSKSLKIGDKLILDETTWFEVTERQDNLFVMLLHSNHDLGFILGKFGQVPLPPYIKRDPNSSDEENYQTIYAKHSGAVAAPTAGLHFDQKLIESINQKNIQTAPITLHVGLGTFQPVRVEKIKDHKIHPEYIDVPKSTCDKIIASKKNGGKIAAIGTTSLRALEASSQSGEITTYKGDTNIFIYPGYTFRTTDILITNFHLPKTSLLMLVCAFAGYENAMRAYQEAIKQNYRFYSYGDAMIIS
ncbi:MAG: tRNA preQ1(34) S-adenosylmethionine ribosyltransferase-isomerase QueA [Gammaproteobacteria bacterium]|nr:tRNA preQ1(34) S-adenosylmethionine ribosyltransferase-isomerase QueA [Gammaproteobacteria bacterium]